MEKKVISHFKEMPKTKIAWWSFGLGVTVMFSGPFLGISAAVFVPYLSRITSEQTSAIIGGAIGFLVIGLVIAALTTGIMAYKKGERSFIMWLGFIPAIFASLMFVMMILGEFIFPH